MDLELVDRNIVRWILQKWSSAETGAQLATLGFPKEMVREVFREVMQQKIDDEVRQPARLGAATSGD